MDVLETLRGFIVDELASTSEISALGDNEPLLETGILDSLGILKLVSFIESKFEVTLPGEEFIPDNFETLSAIAHLISEKQNNSQQKGVPTWHKRGELQ